MALANPTVRRNPATPRNGHAPAPRRQCGPLPPIVKTAEQVAPEDAFRHIMMYDVIDDGVARMTFDTRRGANASVEAFVEIREAIAKRHGRELRADEIPEVVAVEFIELPPGKLTFLVIDGAEVLHTADSLGEAVAFARGTGRTTAQIATAFIDTTLIDWKPAPPTFRNAN